ncbi:MAG: PEP/pyruvate-binding domain-containing protein [Desulfobacterales bacterium]
MTHTLPFHTTEASLEVVGGKGRSLSRMTAAGLPVPAGFHLTTSAYRSFIEDNGLRASILDLVGSASSESASRHIQALFEDKELTKEIRTEIHRAYALLGTDGPAVAVRSSANAEDLPDMSFAGQQDTYLNVRGEEALVAAIRNCWASLWTARAISYRQQMGVDHSLVAMAVVVQVMVEAQVSGILFTANPTTGERSEMIANASFGLGEAIVGGEVTPDSYLIDRESLSAKEMTIGAKEQMIVSDGRQGTATRTVSEAQRRESSLPDPLLKSLASLALRVEDHFDGLPQDIEWAAVDDTLWLLQARPITNLPPAPLKDIRWDPPASGAVLLRRQLVESIPGPVTPLFEALYLTVSLQEAWVRGMIRSVYYRRCDIIDYVVHPTVNGYAYKRVGAPPMSKGVTIPKYKMAFLRWKGKVNYTLRWRPGFLGGSYRSIRRWQDRVAPHYRGIIKQWRQVDPASASDKELISGLEALSLADAIYWFSGVAGILILTRQTEALLHGFLQNNAPECGFTSGAFLSGLRSRTMAAQEDLAAIADRIRREKALCQRVVETPAEKLLGILQDHPQGGPILLAIQRYLDIYGHLGNTLDFGEQSTAEAPLPILWNLKRAVQDSTHDPIHLQTDLARKRKAALREANRYFRGKQWLAFRWRLWLAQRYYPHREEALFLSGAGWPVLRRLALELGQRLVDCGTLTIPDDVFYLTRDELAEACQARTHDEAPVDSRQKTADRRELREARKRLTPPGVVTDQDLSKFQGSMDMWGIRISGGAMAYDRMENAPESDTLNGFACSPGQITAEASVILSPGDFKKMKPGTILVCPTTTPAWTQLFSLAEGLVTDTGGILAHGSIVAREYGIPAVLGTGDITKRVVSGQQISIDGSRGIVTIG